MNIKLIKIILISIFSIFVLLEGFFLFIIPASINSPVVSKKIQQILASKYQIEVKSKGLELKTYPDFKIGLIAENIELLTENNSNFSVNNPNILIKLPNLLSKKIIFSSITANDLFLKFNRKPDNKLYFGNLPIDFNKQSKLNLDIHSSKLVNSKILLVDEIVNNKLETNIKTIDFFYKKNKALGLKLDANVLSNKKQNIVILADFFSKLPFEKSTNRDDFVCDLSIKNLDLKTFSNYFAYFTKTEITSANGIINLSLKKENVLKLNSSLKNFKIEYKNPLDTIYSPNGITLNSEIDFEPKTLVLKDFVAKSKDWSINLAGNIKNYTSLNPNEIKPNLNLKIPNANINTLCWLIPTFKEDELKSIQKIKKYGIWGNTQGTLQLLGSIANPEINGSLITNDVYIVKNNPLVPHSQIFTDFSKDRIKIKTRIFTSPSEYVDVEGEAELKLYGNGSFHIKSTQNVDLETALYMLIPVHQIIGFDLGPVPYMTITGKGNIDIKTQGTILDGEIDGIFNFKQTTATLDGLNLVLKNTDGTLTFDKKNLHFSTNNAYIKEKPITIDGLANLDGKLDFNIISNELDSSQLLYIVNNSKLLEAKKHLFEPIETSKGVVKASIKLTGIVKDFAKIMTNETVVISGNLTLENVTAKLKDIPILLSKTNGLIKFDNNGWNVSLIGKIGNSNIKIKGIADTKLVDIKINGDKVKLSDIVDNLSKIKGYEAFSKLPKINSLTNLFIEYKTPHSLKENNFSFNNVKAKGNIIPLSNPNDIIKVLDGKYTLENGTFVLNNFKSSIGNSNIYSNLLIKKVFSKQPLVSGNLNTKDFDISILNTLKNVELLPNTLRKILIAYEDYQGKIDAIIKVQNNNYDGNISLNGISFVHSYFKTPIQIDAGNIVLDGTKAIIKSIVALVDKTPVYLNLALNDLDKSMKLKGYITTKLTDSFVNKYINTYLTYPIKPKGDITLTADIFGNLDKITIKPIVKLAPDADIYYMGANLGNEADERKITADINIIGNKYYLKKAEYVRFMTSQNDKNYPLPIISANGILEQNPQNKEFYIKNLNIRTQNSANAKLFNALLKKSILKQGLFNCNLNIKGNFKNPKITGDIAVKNVDIPLYNTMLKNINLKLNEQTIDVNADGVVYNSDMKISAIVNNSTNMPYTFEKLDIKSEKLNLDKLIDVLTVIPTPTTTTKLVQHSKSTLPVNISDILIKKGTLSVKDIIIRDLSASNYQSNFSLGNDMVLNVDKLDFDVTTGKMTGTASYNFKKGNFKTNVSALEVDSNKVATSLFGFENQIFGQANGNIVMTTTGSSEEERIKNATGYVYFEITDGKMPKLGSVEYLLKAGNFVKSGITGASINNLLELLAPVKTGYFNSIKGSLALKNGVAQDIEIYSKGDNLNLYINGEYDILQKLANMKVYGRLTKKASGVLGPIGNLSLNSLLNSIPGFRIGEAEKNTLLNDLNKIPGVELNDKDYRRFTVKIDGKINDDNKFVKNFRWIE